MADFSTISGGNIPSYSDGQVITDAFVNPGSLVQTSQPPSPVPNPPEFDSDASTSVAHIYGSNWDVTSKLANISFVPGTSCQMSSSIAYIRYWSRKGTKQKTTVNDTAVNGVPNDPQAAITSDLNNLFGSVLNPGLTTPSPAATTSRTVLATPTNSAYQSRPRQPVPTQVTSSAGQVPTPVRSGSVFSANPGGTLATASPRASSDAPSPDDAVWQFLFNPEELQLSSGPDFNRAETWGVADPANSGQPLSWRSNKNRKLTFGKVLLHGYTFGKRVDSLEKGLQDLFLARDGENGSDGPPVLEFVWGRRVFGPCVIQNIQVREKAWDKGLLVNAEVSFELEQVPEWTINDGFVDVLRPGRQSTINDPSLPGRMGTTGGTTRSAGEDTTPPPRTAPDASPQTSLDPTLCNFAVRQSKIFQTLFDRADVLLRYTFFDPSLLNQKSELDSVIRSFLSIKGNFYQGSQEIGKFVDSKLNNNGCIQSKYQDTLGSIASENGTEEQKKVQALKFAHACIRETKQYINKWQQTSPKCKAQRVSGRQLRLAKEKQQELNKQCEQIKPGNSCAGSPNLSERTISTCNSGKTVVCVRRTWELKYPGV